MLARISILALLAAPAISQSPPPGLARIQGTRVQVGSDTKEVERMIRDDLGKRHDLAGETPLHVVAVEDFYLGVTEVTVEQYAAFVAATGARPPWTWCLPEVIDEARARFHEEDQRSRREAEERGRQRARGVFVVETWWKERWPCADWEVPAQRLDHPVAFVDYADVLAYCRWAGLRPMTELEYQCAARGDTSRRYPWGDEWDASHAASLESGRAQTFPVASFPGGAVNGIYDLAGNVWEWTGSPYQGFPGNRGLTVSLGEGRRKSEIEAYPRFDPDRRVGVGGGFVSSKAALRIATRRPMTRTQSAEAVGFRVAASVVPGADLARHVFDREIDRTFLPPEIELDFERPVILQRWTQVPGTARVRANGSDQGAVPGYAVITAHDYALFVPTFKLPHPSIKQLARDSHRVGPPVLGMLCLSRPTLEPALEAGNYFLLWRAAGKLGRTKAADEVAGEDVATPYWRTPGFQPEVDCLFITDARGEPIVAFPTEPLDYVNMQAGRIVVEPFEPPAKVGATETAPEPMDTLRFSIQVAGRRAVKGFRFELALKIAPRSIDERWH